MLLIISRVMRFIFLQNAKAHAPRSAGAGFGRGVGVVAWGGHENWAADRGCHAATCSWKEIPRKHGCIHGRSSPNPAPAQVTKPAPRRIGGTQAHKLLLRGIGAANRKSCHIHRRLISMRHPVIIGGHVMSPPETHQARTDTASLQICHRSSIPHERRARAPLPAGAGVALGVEVEWMERHENRTAGRGCTMRLDRPLLRDGFSAASIRRMRGIG